MLKVKNKINKTKNITCVELRRTNQIFEDVFLVCRIHFKPKKFVYAFIRLAGKTYFFQVSRNPEKCGLEVYYGRRQCVEGGCGERVSLSYPQKNFD